MLAPNAAILLAFAAALCFGLALVLTQLGLRHLPPRRGAMISLPMATALLWVLSPVTVEWQAARLDAALVFALVGLLFPVTVTLLTFEANRRMGPAVAGALGNLTPLFAVLVAVAALGERPSLLQLAGLLAIVLGVAALSLDRRWLDLRWPLWVAAFPLAAAAVRGLVQPITKLGLALWPDPFAAVLCGYSVSTLVILGIARLGPTGERAAPSRTGIAWFVLIGIANATAVLTLYAALARGTVLLVSPLVATYPLVTLALTAVLIRPGAIGRPQLAGVALTVLGAALLILGR